jgi:hypothetical protein
MFSPLSFGGELRGGGTPAKAALSPPEFFERGIQIGNLKIRPHLIGEQQFGVSRLPQEKIRKPPFSTRAYEQIDIAAVAGERRT